MGTPNRSLTPSQLSALEQAYSKSPAEGWRDLAEAYLARGRAMEAMVVAKRGARVRPDDPAPHLVLARIHGAQRKADKARAAAAEALRLAPRDAAVVALAREHGLLPAEQPAPGSAEAPPSRDPAHDAGAAAAADAAGQPGSPPAETAPHRDAEVARWTEELSRRYGDDEPPEPSVRRRRAKRGALRTVSLALVLGGVLAAAWWVTTARQQRADEQQRLVADAERLMARDTWPAYRDAQAECEKAAALGGDAAAAHACAAWAAAVRWAEHGEGEPLRAKALDHLARAAPAGERERDRDAVLADAWLKLYGGDASGALELLRARNAKDGSPAVRAALGVALLDAGDLDAARDALAAAQQLAPGSPRIAEQLAEAFRRRGAEGARQAATLYEIVLQKLAPDHVPSLVGKARLLLDAHDAPAALAIAQHVAALKDQASPRQRARALLVASRALAQQGKKAEAEAAEREARGLDATAPDVRGPVAQAGR